MCESGCARRRLEGEGVCSEHGARCGGAMGAWGTFTEVLERLFSWDSVRYFPDYPSSRRAGPGAMGAFIRLSFAYYAITR